MTCTRPVAARGARGSARNCESFPITMTDIGTTIPLMLLLLSLLLLAHGRCADHRGIEETFVLSPEDDEIALQLARRLDDLQFNPKLAKQSKPVASRLVEATLKEDGFTTVSLVLALELCSFTG